MFYKHKVKELIHDEKKFLKMVAYVELIEKKNKVMNLTGFNQELLWKEGIYETLMCFLGIDFNGKFLDIGAGVGFPSLPLLIANPHMELTIIESQTKRINFLQEVAYSLDLTINLINARAENIQTNTFNFITARAVAPLFKLIEISHHLGTMHATFYLIKGDNVNNELNDAQKIINKLQIKNIVIIKKVIAGKTINIVKYLKTKATPKGIPRNWAQIKNSDSCKI